MTLNDGAFALDANRRLCDPQHMHRTLVLTVAALTAGCVAPERPAPQTQAAPPPAAAPLTPGLAAVAGIGPGAVSSADDPDLGGPVTLTVLSSYTAASGRQCKRVAVRQANGASSARVACNGTAGWYWTPASIG